MTGSRRYLSGNTYGMKDVLQPFASAMGRRGGYLVSGMGLEVLWVASGTGSCSCARLGSGGIVSSSDGTRYSAVRRRQDREQDPKTPRSVCDSSARAIRRQALPPQYSRGLRPCVGEDKARRA